MIRGSFIILLFYFLGELLSYLLGSFLPGSVIGMILLFLSLFFKLIQPEAVRAVATSITKNMALFFVPAAVGLMVYVDVVSNNFGAIFLGITISTLLTMFTVGFIQERMENRRNRNRNIK